MGAALAKFLFDRSGVTAIEYGVMACAIALVLIAAAGSTGLHVNMVLKHAVALVSKGRTVAQ